MQKLTGRIFLSVFLPNLYKDEPKWGEEAAKVRKWTFKGSKSESTGAKSEPIGAKRSPQGCQRELKGSNKGTKGRQREPKGGKGDQKRAQSEPKGDQNIPKSIFGKGREKGAKMVVSSYAFWLRFGIIFHQKTMKKSMQKSMPKKSWKIMKKRCKHDAILDWKSSKNWSCAKSA